MAAACLFAYDNDSLWRNMKTLAQEIIRQEPVLARHLQRKVLTVDRIGTAMARMLACRLACKDLPADMLEPVLAKLYANSPVLEEWLLADLLAVVERDPCARDPLHPYLHHKGFHALQAHRLAHSLWTTGRSALALHLHSRSSIVFAVDIHPAARLGARLFIDHATGVVIGETAVVGDDVSMLQGVTLGGTGKERGDRHPKVGNGVLVSAGATILGNIRIGAGARVGAGSVVLQHIPPNTTAVGVPAQVVSRMPTPVLR